MAETESDRYDVILIGDWFCDLIFTGLPRIPELGAEVYGTGFDATPGGAFYTALALHRLGVRSGWLTDFGNDVFSRFVLETIERHGLDTRLFIHRSAPLRRISVAMSFPIDRAFVTYVDPPPQPDLAQVIERHQPRWVMFASLEVTEERQAVLAAARRAGAQVYLDCQHTEATLETPGLIEMLRSVHIFAPNEIEALQLTGASSVEAALAQLAALTPVVVVKLGAEGALAQSGNEVARAPALPVNVVDTTGAGDCFNAGFMYGYLRGYSLQDCLRCGNLCGALAITSRGCDTVPTATQLEGYLRQAK